MKSIGQLDVMKLRKILNDLKVEEKVIASKLENCDSDDRELLEKELIEVKKKIIVNEVLLDIQVKEDAVRNVGFEIRQLCLDTVIVGLITVLQISYPQVSLWIVDIDSRIKSIIIIGLYLFFLSDKVINRAFHLSTVLDKKNKKPNIVNLFGIPSILDFLAWLAIIFIAYFLFLLIPMYDTLSGYLITYIINLCLYSILKRKINLIYHRLNNKIKTEVEDFKDRITIQIAIAGLIISIIALLI